MEGITHSDKPTELSPDSADTLNLLSLSSLFWFFVTTALLLSHFQQQAAEKRPTQSKQPSTRQQTDKSATSW